MMKYLTQRALYYTFAANEIGGECAKNWRFFCDLFGVSPEERQAGEELLSDRTLASLRTVEDVRLFQKCASGFGGTFGDTAARMGTEVLDLKLQALGKIRQLTGESRLSPLKAIASAYEQDSTAAVLYAAQILAQNGKRRKLGCEILFGALTRDLCSDAGIVLLNAGTDRPQEVYRRLAETPEMILHPSVAEEVAAAHGLDPRNFGDSPKIGF